MLRSRLSARLAALFLLGSLVPVVGAAVLAHGVFEDSIREDAERRQRLVAERAAALVSSEIERAEAKLTTIARLLAADLGPLRARGLGAPDEAYRGAVLERLTALVEPPDAFLELQYFASGERVAPEPLAEAVFVGQAQQAEVALSQQRAPDAEQRNRESILSNMNSEAVQLPLREGTPHRDGRLESHEGFVTLKVSCPIESELGTEGALVAYVDFAPLREELRSVAGERFRLRVEDGGGTVLVEAGAIEGERSGRAFALGAALGEAASPPWQARVEESAAALEAPLARLNRKIVLWTALAAALSTAASFVLSAWITGPIAKLRAAAERMQAGDLSARVRVRREDEIGRLGAAFDGMAESLARLDVAKSEFVANVSHELRTPLASMRLALANLLEGVSGEPSASQRPALERLRRDLERTSALVAELLELARLEAGAVAPSQATTDLAALARECAEDLRELAAAKRVVIAVEGRGSACADPALTRRVLANLLDNAVKFSPPGARVEVEVRAGGFSVRDQGPGLADERAFEKFHQGASDGVKHPGVGLGLAIVKKLVELQGGAVRVAASGARGGAVLEVSLPESEA